MLARRCLPPCPPTPPGAHARAREAGVPIAPWPPASSESPGLVIDALLGIGGSRPPCGDIAAAIGLVAAFAARGVPVLAVDVPSGLDPERGQPLGDACIVAQHTLALIGARPGPVHRRRAATSPARSGPTPSASISTAHAPDAWLVGTGRDRPGRAAAPPRRAQGQLRRRRHRRRRRRHGRRGAARRASGACRGRRPGLRRSARRRRGDARARFRAARADAAPGLVAGRRHDGRAEHRGLRLRRRRCGARRPAPPRRPRLPARARCRRAQRRRRRHRPADGAGRARQPRPRHRPDAAPARGRAAPRQRRRRRSRPIASAPRSRWPSATAPPSSSRARAASSPTPGEAPRICATGNASLATAGTGDVLAGWIGGRWRPGTTRFDAATLAVVEHGAAAEPAQAGALRAADLIERLYRRGRDRLSGPRAAQPAARIALPTSSVPCAAPLSGTVSPSRSEISSQRSATCSAASPTMPTWMPCVSVT